MTTYTDCHITLEEAWILAGTNQTFDEYCAGIADALNIYVCFRHPDRLSEGKWGAGLPICQECYDTYWEWNRR